MAMFYTDEKKIVTKLLIKEKIKRKLSSISIFFSLFLLK